MGFGKALAHRERIVGEAVERLGSREDRDALRRVGRRLSIMAAGAAPGEVLHKGSGLDADDVAFLIDQVERRLSYVSIPILDMGNPEHMEMALRLGEEGGDAE